MTKFEKNSIISSLFTEKIESMGLSGKLSMFPITTPFMRRPSYWRKGDECIFAVFLWQLNKLPEKELDIEISNRINKARLYFKI